jgi:hypothetical protein
MSCLENVEKISCPIKSLSGRVFGAFLQVTMTCIFFEKARFEE